MALLKSVDDVAGINYYEYRDQNYWNEYVYRARIKVPGGRFTYCFDNIVDWKAKVAAGHWGWRNKLTDDEKQYLLSQEDVVKKFFEFKKEFKKNKSGIIRTEGITTAIFSNDLSLLHSVRDWNLEVDFTEVKTSEYAGTKFFVKEPKFKFRVYLKSKRIGNGTHSDLRDLFSTQKSLRPSKAFKSWMYGEARKWRHAWLSSSFFIEYDDESTLSYLMLLHGDILGKKYNLKKRPEELTE